MSRQHGASSKEAKTSMKLLHKLEKQNVETQAEIHRRIAGIQQQHDDRRNQALGVKPSLTTGRRKSVSVARSPTAGGAASGRRKSISVRSGASVAVKKSDSFGSEQ